ncbi:MAG TPA: trypsin-like peptidase domain-containing protein [Longimicrobiales bacterium]
MFGTIWNKTKAVVVFVGLIAVIATLAGGVARTRAAARERAMPDVSTAFAPPPTTTTGPEVANAFAAVAERITPAVVRIETERLGAERPRFMPRPLQNLIPDDSAAVPPELSGGSGFLVSANGYILTNNHVIEGADFITVTLYDKRTLTGRVIGLDATTDIALIKIEAQGLPHLRLGDSDQARVGEWVLAIGNPGFDETSTLDFTVTGGIISAKGRPLNVLNAATENGAGNFAIEDFLQTDAAINPGNSGGPLVNIRGEVIGINTAIASSNGFNQGYAFAVPSNLARRVMTDLLKHGRVRRPLLGISIEDVTQEDAEVYGLREISGALIEHFADESPAQRSGIQRGDVIVAVDGVKVERVGQLQRLVAQHQPGDFVELRVIRYGKPHSFRVKLVEAEIPQNETAERSAPRPNGAGRLGIQVGDLTPEIAQELGFDDAGGAVITAVANYGAAHRKNIETGSRILEINREPIESAREAQNELRALRSSQVVSLTLQLPNGRVYIANVRVP